MGILLGAISGVAVMVGAYLIAFAGAVAITKFYERKNDER